MKNFCDKHNAYFGKGFFGRGKRRCYQCEREIMIQSKHALILNRLHEMQRLEIYASVRGELKLAEETIVSLEKEVNELKKDIEDYQKDL